MAHIKIGKDSIAHEGKYLRMIHRQFRGSAGSGIWEFVERKTHGPIVAVLPVTKKNEVILIKTLRIPWKRYIVEMCAGLMDKKGESQARLVRRELLEETGYRAGRLEKLIEGPYNAGLSTDSLAIYLAREATYVRKPVLENAEDITVLKVPLARLAHFLAHPPKGVLVDVKLFSILYWLRKRGYPC